MLAATIDDDTFTPLPTHAYMDVWESVYVRVCMALHGGYALGYALMNTVFWEVPVPQIAIGRRCCPRASVPNGSLGGKLYLKLRDDSRLLPRRHQPSS